MLIWLERKVAARVQDRLGPTRVGGGFGWLQTLADGIKLLSKEDLMPGGADGLLFRAAPYVSMMAAFTAMLALPFSGSCAATAGAERLANPFVGQQLNVGLYFVLAVLGLEVFGVVLAGYSSASKWSLFGAMREAAQVVSYEVPLGFCLVVPVALAGSMDLVVIGDLQGGGFWNWNVLHDPFTFITVWVYGACATASVNRAPFDLAEAESELVAGFHTEYSGLRWSFFFMAEYGSMITVGVLGAILFFGAWHAPVPVAWGLGLPPGGWLSSIVGDTACALLCNAMGAATVLIKGLLAVVVMMWVRWTLPRLRIDQVMTTCLKYCTPLAASMFVGMVLWQALLPGRVLMGALPHAPSNQRVEEPWREASAHPETRAL